MNINDESSSFSRKPLGVRSAKQSTATASLIAKTHSDVTSLQTQAFPDDVQHCSQPMLSDTQRHACTTRRLALMIKLYRDDDDFIIKA